jgi:hypothetical protein
MQLLTWIPLEVPLVKINSQLCQEIFHFDFSQQQRSIYNDEMLMSQPRTMEIVVPKAGRQATSLGPK